MQLHKLSFPSGHRRLAACVFDSSHGGKARSGVLFIHGQGSSQRGYEQRARMTSLNLDAVCLTFDLSGHGCDAASFERYSVNDHLEDVVAAYDYLASHARVDSKRVGVCGASYGGYLGALLTAHRAVKRLILRAPSLVKDIALPTLKERPSTSKEAPEGFDSLAVLRRYSGKVLILESEKDEVIPKSHIAAYLRACPHAQHQVIPEATHALTNPKWDEAFVNAIVYWFGDL
jgi:pimeloyl-ACP methyl ester carboxylesterase